MATEFIEDPWQTLSALIAANDARSVRDFIEELESFDTARTISRLSLDDQAKLLALLGPSDSAVLLGEVPEAQAADIVEQLLPEDAAAILDRVRSDDQADLLAQIPVAGAEAILERMSPDEASDARQLLEYPEDTAGGIMMTEFLAYRGDWTINRILRDLEQHRESYADYSVQYLYVVDEQGCLEGVLRVRDLLFSMRDAVAAKVMIREPISIPVDTGLVDMESVFERRPLVAVPVVDGAGRLVGVVRRAAVEEAAGDRVTRHFLGVSGIVGGEEFRTMPLVARSGRRLSWLTINIVLNMIAASVIALYTDTLSAAIALAVFLPMISDMSGCSGNQAVAVSMRELTLGLVRPTETLRVIGKEVGLGALNGLVLGVLLGTAAFLWKRNPYLGLVVGAALAANTIVAVCLGGALPLVLKRLKLDPALVSGPVLTTVTDMCGFFLALSLATTLLAKLG